jgi:hypothetical protein
MKIPVEQKMGDLINQVRTRDELGWKNSHLKTIEHTYKKAPFFNEVFTDFSSLLIANYSNIAEMNQVIIEFVCRKFGFLTEFKRSSDLNINATREEKVLDICNAIGATVYYSGSGARVYQVEENFINRGLELQYSHFTPFEYPQFFEGFQSNICFLDYLMHCGYDWGRVQENQSK